MREIKKRVTALDAVFLLLIIIAAVYLYFRIKSGLEYNWNWSVIPQYLFRYDAEKGRWVANVLIQGLLTTIRLSIWSTLLAMLLGLLMGLFRTSSGLLSRLLGGTYVFLTRNLPPLVLVFICYFFFSEQLMPILGLEEFIRSLSPQGQEVFAWFFTTPSRASSFVSAVLTLSLYEGAYIAEIVRGGIQSIDKGQWEASHALGLSRWSQMRFIILPQAIKRMIPPLAGQFISTIKDSAIVSVISVQELTFQGMELMSATYRTFEIWIVVTGLYLLLTLSLAFAARCLENKFKSEY